MFRDEFVVKKGFLTSARVYLFARETAETIELLNIASVSHTIKKTIFVTVSEY